MVGGAKVCAKSHTQHGCHAKKPLPDQVGKFHEIWHAVYIPRYIVDSNDDLKMTFTYGKVKLGNLSILYLDLFVICLPFPKILISETPWSKGKIICSRELPCSQMLKIFSRTGFPIFIGVTTYVIAEISEPLR